MICILVASGQLFSLDLDQDKIKQLSHDSADQYEVMRNDDREAQIVVSKQDKIVRLLGFDRNLKTRYVQKIPPNLGEVYDVDRSLTRVCGYEDNGGYCIWSRRPDGSWFTNRLSTGDAEVYAASFNERIKKLLIIFRRRAGVNSWTDVLHVYDTSGYKARLVSVPYRGNEYVFCASRTDGWELDTTRTRGRVRFTRNRFRFESEVGHIRCGSLVSNEFITDQVMPPGNGKIPLYGLGKDRLLWFNDDNHLFLNESQISSYRTGILLVPG